MDGLISVVLPVYNQADHIVTVVEEFRAALSCLGRPAELILVPNGCVDSSSLRCGELAQQYRDVRVIECPRAGWGAAVRRGLQAAKGDLLCYTNSARTSAADLALLLTYALRHPDVVVKANRKFRDSRVRRLGSLLYNLECRALFDLPVWDINGTPKVFPRKFEALLGLQRDDDLIDIEYLIACRQHGYPIIEVPILSARRAGGYSTTTFGSAVKLYLGALAMARERPASS
jgi:glycosyltransferase involved in cell wall biosynthesis